MRVPVLLRCLLYRCRHVTASRLIYCSIRSRCHFYRTLFFGPSVLKRKLFLPPFSVLCPEHSRAFRRALSMFVISVKHLFSTIFEIKAVLLITSGAQFCCLLYGPCVRYRRLQFLVVLYISLPITFLFSPL